MTDSHDPVDKPPLLHREESPTPDPVQRLRDSFAAASAEDRDGVTANFAPNTLWVMDTVGLGPFVGVDAIREFLLEWWSLWQEHHHYVEEAVVLSEHVGYAMIRENGRMKDGGSVVETRVAHVIESIDGLVVRDTTYTDIGAVHTAAEHLAAPGPTP